MVACLRDTLSRLLVPAVGLCLLAILGLAFAQVVLRYLFAASILWVEEVSVMALAWMTWLGAVHLWLNRAHLTADIVPVAVWGRWRKRLDLAINALACAGAVALVVVTWQTLNAFAGIELGALEIDARIKYYPVLAGACGLAIAAALELARLLTADPDAA